MSKQESQGSPEPGLEPPNPPHLQDGYAERRKREQAQKANAAEAARVNRRDRRALLQALDRAAFGPKANRVIEHLEDGLERVRIAPGNWARLICKAAKLFKDVLGADMLDSHPVPEYGDGSKAGAHMFRQACAGRSVEGISQDIRVALKALGPCPPDDQNWSDSEIGLARYFGSLVEHYDGVEWRAPRRIGVSREPPTSISRKLKKHHNQKVPFPERGDLLIAKEKLAKMEPQSTVTPDDVLELYGLKGRVDPSSFRRSSVFIARRPGQAKRSTVLPRPMSPRAHNPANGLQLPMFKWPVAEVSACVDAWLRKFERES